MSLRVTLIVVMVVLMATGLGTADFTTPSLDQGRIAERVIPREPAVARDGSAVWVAPTSIVLVSGAPVSVQNLQQDTPTTLAAGEAVTLRPVSYVGPADVYTSPAAAVYTIPAADVYRVYTIPAADVYTVHTADVYEVYPVGSASPAMAAPATYRTYGRVADIRANGDVEIRTDAGRAVVVTLSPEAVRAIQEGTDVSIDTTFSPGGGTVLRY